MGDRHRSRSRRAKGSVSDEDLFRLSRRRMVEMYNSAMSRICTLEAKANEVTICSRCNNRSKDEEDARQAIRVATTQVKFLRRKLAIKDLELQNNNEKLLAIRKSVLKNSLSSLKCPLQDPASNILIQKLREELSATKTKLEETQNELLAWKFTPDSNVGKQLMGRVRLLLAENKELGEEINSGHIAKLEGELALQKNFVEEVKKSQLEVDGFLQDIDEETEGAQSVIYALQNQLKNCIISVENTVKEVTESNNANGIKRYASGIIEDTPSVSKTETQTLSAESKSESKSSECDKSKVPFIRNDQRSIQPAKDNNPKEKKHKSHKKKHKSNRSKGEKKLPKVEKKISCIRRIIMNIKD